ncbi:hypothetical protein AB6E88_21715 [Providencia hangzhouensis]
MVNPLSPPVKRSIAFAVINKVQDITGNKGIFTNYQKNYIRDQSVLFSNW